MQRLVKNPTAIAEEKDESASTPASKKRSRHASKSSEKHVTRINVDEDEEEEGEEAESESYGAHSGLASPGPIPYYNSLGNTHGWTPSPISTAYPYSYPVPPSAKPNWTRSMSRSRSASRMRNPSGATEEDEDVEENMEEEERSVASDLEEDAPKAKRRKSASVRADQTLHSNGMWNGPVGLQMPSMGEVPLGGYHGGYGTPWWTNTAPPSPWTQQSMSHGQDNATLWAYYYYGYAMGQYDAFNIMFKQQQS